MARGSGPSVLLPARSGRPEPSPFSFGPAGYGSLPHYALVSVGRRDGGAHDTHLLAVTRSPLGAVLVFGDRASPCRLRPDDAGTGCCADAGGECLHLAAAGAPIVRELVDHIERMAFTVSAGPLGTLWYPATGLPWPYDFESTYVGRRGDALVLHDSLLSQPVLFPLRSPGPGEHCAACGLSACANVTLARAAARPRADGVRLFIERAPRPYALSANLSESARSCVEAVFRLRRGPHTLEARLEIPLRREAPVAGSTTVSAFLIDGAGTSARLFREVVPLRRDSRCSCAEPACDHEALVEALLRPLLPSTVPSTGRWLDAFARRAGIPLLITPASGTETGRFSAGPAALPPAAATTTPTARLAASTRRRASRSATAP